MLTKHTALIFYFIGFVVWKKTCHHFDWIFSMNEAFIEKKLKLHILTGLTEHQALVQIVRQFDRNLKEV